MTYPSAHPLQSCPHPPGSPLCSSGLGSWTQIQTQAGQGENTKRNHSTTQHLQVCQDSVKPLSH